jgi:hypothetical protein
MDVRTQLTVIPPGPHDVRWGSPALPPPLSGEHSCCPPRPDRLSPTGTTTPRAPGRLVKDVSHDIKRWHGGGYPEYALDGLVELSEDNLQSLDVVKPYYDPILKLHEQLLSAMFRTNFDKAAMTWAPLKHPAWDNLANNSPKGWMEFNKFLRRNAMTFAIALIPIEAFNMAYRDTGHCLCLCGLGIRHYRLMGHSLFSILQPLLPQEDTFICSQIKSVANDSSNRFELLWTLKKHYITMFDLRKEPSWPGWHHNIFRYAKRVLIHCNLSRHCNTTYVDAHHSLLFLNGLQG